MVVMDFIDPDTREWYAAKLSALLHVGVRCFKSGFGERIPTHVTYFDGSESERMHNYGTYPHNLTIFPVPRERRGLSIGMSGSGYWSCDISGFEGGRTRPCSSGGWRWGCWSSRATWPSAG